MGYNNDPVNQQVPSSVSEEAYVAPPPAGYPVKDAPMNIEQKVAVKTKSRGEGFWEGCCAALCCCCVFETCF